MEEQTNELSTTRVGLKYGLFTGVASLGYSTLLSLLRLQNDSFLSLLTIGLVVAGIVYAMKEYKNANEDYMTFSQGLGIGTVVSAIYGLLSGVFTLIYFQFINTTELLKLRQEMILQYEKNGMEDEMINQLMPWIEWLTSSGSLFVFGVVGNLFFGFLLSLAISAIMAKNRPMFE